MYKNTNRKLVAGIVAGIFVLSAFVMTGTAFGSATKITICHRTLSDTNPWNILVVSENAWKEDGGGVHGGHPDDVHLGYGDLSDSVTEAHCAGDYVPD